MNEFLDLAQKFSSASLATLLVLILIGSYKGIWVWGYQLRNAEAEKEQWKAMTFSAAGLAETSVNIAAKKGQ